MSRPPLPFPGLTGRRARWRRRVLRRLLSALLAAAAVGTAAITAIAALGTLFGPASEFVFVGTAVAWGLLSGAASVLSLDIATSALRTRDLG